jgi:hypothetical protein
MKVLTPLTLAAMLLGSSWLYGEKYGDYDVLASSTLQLTGGEAMTDRGGGLAFDGTHLWYTTYNQGSNSGVLYRLDPNTRAVLASWPLPFEAHGIAWDGTQLRIADTRTEPRIRSYDRDGNLLGSQLVDADTTNFRGIAWDGVRLWGIDDGILYGYYPDGTAEKVHANSWYGISTDLSFDGTHLVALANTNGWSGAFAPYTIRIDPANGNVSGYYKVGTNVGSPDTHHLAIGFGRMWIVHGNGIETVLREVAVPVPAPFPPITQAWGVFTAFEGFAIPHRPPPLTGASLGSHGRDFWYGDYLNISKVRWNQPTDNTAALDLGWPMAGGCTQDITSDGTRVWLIYFDRDFPAAPNRLGEMNLQGQIVRSFPLQDEPEGLAWDGQSLWVTHNRSPQSGKTCYLSRYSTEGELLQGPTQIGADEFGLFVTDATWHDGELWLLDENDGLDSSGNYGSILRVDPATGTILARYRTGGQNGPHGGITSDGQHLFVIAEPKRGNIGTPPGAVFPSIIRIGMPADMTPPRIASGTATPSSIVVTFDELVVASTALMNKANYLLECPPGTPVDLTNATLTVGLNPRNRITLSGLSLVAGSAFKLTARRARDDGGNDIREDGVGNVLFGTVGGLTAPAALAPQAIGSTRVTLSFRDASAGETGFRIERRTQGNASWSEVANVPSTTGASSGSLLTLIDSNLAAGVVYVYRAFAYGDSVESPASNVLQISLVDSDSDGWPDQHENQISRTNPFRSDTDGDGVDDPLEGIAGTNPKDNASVFVIKELTREASGAITLRWVGAAGKTYRVVRSQSPSFATFDIIGTSIPGVTPLTFFTDPNAAPPLDGKAFYRVEVE